MSGLASMRHVALLWAGRAQVSATPVRPIHTRAMGRTLNGVGSVPIPADQVSFFVLVVA